MDIKERNMKKYIAAFAGIMMMAVSTLSSGLESSGYRFVIDASVDGDTPVVVTEIELLWDDDASSSTVDVDATEADLGRATCGWTSAAGVNGCDSVSTNRRGTANSNYPGETRSRRQTRVMFDNSMATYFTTNDKVDADNLYYVQHNFYKGILSPSRYGTDTLRSPAADVIDKADVTAYSIVVPSSSVTTGAPASLTMEYWDSTVGDWVLLDTQTSNDVNWTNAGNVYNVSGAYYLVNSAGTYLWVTATGWGEALTGATLTTATTAIEGGTLVARHLEFSL